MTALPTYNESETVLSGVIVYGWRKYVFERSFRTTFSPSKPARKQAENDIPVQHLQYLPFGERFVDEHTSYQERFTFTGKETDCETGYSYFGARYYDPTLLTSWTAVDPMSDKYPSLSPYNYCAWDPMIVVDPNGCDSVHSPNGMVNAGEGYKSTPDGQYLYGEGLQTKKWNPDLEIGGIGEGLCGGYEDYAGAPIDFNSYSLDGQLSTSNNISTAWVMIPTIASLGEGLFTEVASIAGGVLETAANFVWIIPACLLLSGDSSPNRSAREINNSITSDIDGAKNDTFHPFAHDSRKNGRLKGSKADRHDAQYNHGGKQRKPNPNQRKGANERRNRGKRIN